MVYCASRLKTGVVKLPINNGAFELLIVGGVIERQFAIGVPRVRVRARLAASVVFV